MASKDRGGVELPGLNSISSGEKVLANLFGKIETKKYSITINMVVGEFKFRLDDAWTLNYGDDGNNLSLEAGGANIPITVAGSYTIVADFTAKSYTIKKN